jgi:hypothetical protein
LFQKENALADFRELLRVLGNLSSNKEETQIQFFEGAQGIKKIHEDILLKLKYADESTRELLSFSSGAHLVKNLSGHAKSFYQ